jgi:hypothetical protein
MPLNDRPAIELTVVDGPPDRSLIQIELDGIADAP